MRYGSVIPAWLLTAGFVTLLGCRMCCSPYDEAGPVLNEHGRPIASSRYRAGSILQTQPSVSPAVKAGISPSNRLGHTQKSYPKKVTGVGVQTATSERIPETMGKPLTREEMEPFIDLGIPPENIISIEDRPLSEVQSTLSAESEVASSIPRDRREPANPAPKPLVSSGSQPNHDGWIRLGSRTGTTLK